MDQCLKLCYISRVAILKLKKNDEVKERQFELENLRKLTIQQRFRMMFQRSKIMRNQLIANGYRQSPEIIKRKQG